ncbi:MAG: hypothetical protein ACYCYI_00775 [Saccharofermentanales bacterium]
MKEKQNKNPNIDFSFKTEEKVSVILGAYGSGKSEVSVNLALFLADKANVRGYTDVVLADLDMINPYFRSLDAKAILNDNGIQVISPKFANTNVEAPALPGEIYSVFDRDGVRAVLDIGGEDLGARVVASMKNRILSVSHAIYMVVNMNRPFTDTKEKVASMLKELEEAAGIEISGLINNTNLLSLTQTQDLLDANRVLAEIAEETSIRFCFCSGMDEDYPADWGNTAPDGVPFLRLKHTINY